MGKIYHTIDCILQLLDESTGRPSLLSDFHVQDQTGRFALPKSGGLFVFVGNTSSELHITIRSPFYQTVSCSVSGLQKKSPLKIWLTPSCKHPNWNTMCVLRGNTSPEEIVTCWTADFQTPYRLLHGLVSEESVVHLFASGNENLENTTFLLSHPDLPSQTIYLGKQIDTHSYQLETPFPIDFPVVQTTVSRMQQTTAANDGSFVFIFRNIRDNNAHCTIHFSHKKETQRVLLLPRQVNFLL